MKLIVAADERDGIGKGGEVPWRLPEDLARFKRLTMGGVVVMGRRTWDSLPPHLRPLPGRFNVVVTSNPNRVQGALGTCNGLENLPWVYGCSGDVPGFASAPVWCIGGGEVYRQALEFGLVDEVHLTRVQGDFACDTTWPGVPAGWECTMRDPPHRDLWRYSKSRSVDGAPRYRYEVWVKKAYRPRDEVSS